MIANALSGGGFNGHHRVSPVIENHGHTHCIALFERSSSLQVDYTSVANRALDNSYGCCSITAGKPL